MGVKIVHPKEFLCLQNLPIKMCFAIFFHSLQEQETVQGATMLLSDIATHEAIEMDFVQFQVVPRSWVLS